MPDIRTWRGTSTTMAPRCRTSECERSPEPGGSRDQSMVRSGVGTLAVVGSLLLASATLAAGLAHDFPPDRNESARRPRVILSNVRPCGKSGPRIAPGAPLLRQGRHFSGVALPRK